MKHPVKFRMFLFSQLPSAYFAGVRIRELDEKHCIVTVPFKWFSKNPFRSIYFACLSMAAEMSTGALAMAHVFKLRPPVSMLVLKVESSYFKKATGRTKFLCEDGGLIQKAIEDAVTSGEAQIIRSRSAGTNKDGEAVAEFFITWLFKTKKSEKT